MRDLLAVAALAAVTLACSDSSDQALAPALGPAIGSLAGACPAKFTLSNHIGLTKHTRIVGRDPADDNADSFVCYVQTKDATYNESGDLQSMGVQVRIDNNIPPEQLGKCPLTFTAYAAYGAEEDLNGNSVVCQTQSEDIGLVTVDDSDQ